MGGRIGFESTPGLGSRFWCKIAFDTDPDFAGDVKSQCAERIAAVIAIENDAQLSALQEHLSVMGVSVIADGPVGRQQRVLSDPELWARGNVLIFCDERQAMSGSVQRLLRLLPRTDLVRSEAILVGAEPDSGLLEPTTFGGYITDPDNGHEVRNAVRVQCQRWFVGGQPDDLEPVSVCGESGNSLHVLVAEDNATNQFVIRMVLEKAGHSVEVAEDGAVALQALAKRRFDAILLDMHMPGMDGIDVARQFAKDNPGHGIPIVMLTADSTADACSEAAEAGVAAFLTKPMDPRALLEALSRGLDCGSLPVEDSVLDSQVLHDLRLTAGSPSSGYEVAMRFLRDCEQGLAAFAKELPERDWQALKRRAHAVKGCAASAGALQLGRVSFELEQALLVQDWALVNSTHQEAVARLREARMALKASFSAA
jgi:CheY-like chemotaxis protein